MKKKCKHQQKRIVQNKYFTKLIRINQSKKFKKIKYVAIAVITMIQWLLSRFVLISNKIIYILSLLKQPRGREKKQTNKQKTINNHSENNTNIIRSKKEREKRRDIKLEMEHARETFPG